MRKGLKISNKEFEAYQDAGENVLSDMDYGFDSETKEWTVPKLEWECYYGSRWSSYVSEEAREEALNEYQDKMDAWVLNYRAEIKIAKLELEYEKARIKNLNTLGGQFPQLSTLKTS